jgi:uncharacterized SAM-binding protein YcdF (DUF218 family)
MSISPACAQVPFQSIEALQQARTVFIVLGCSVNPDLTPSDWLTARLQALCNAAAHLRPEQQPFCVIVSGAAVRSTITEAECMSRWLAVNAAGDITPELIVKEEQAHDTLQNFDYSMLLLKAHANAGALKNLMIVTNDFHMTRALKLLELGMEFAQLKLNNDVAVQAVVAHTPGLLGAELAARQVREKRLLVEAIEYHSRRMTSTQHV